MFLSMFYNSVSLLPNDRQRSIRDTVSIFRCISAGTVVRLNKLYLLLISSYGILYNKVSVSRFYATEEGRYFLPTGKIVFKLQFISPELFDGAPCSQRHRHTPIGCFFKNHHDKGTLIYFSNVTASPFDFYWKQQHRSITVFRTGDLFSMHRRV